MEVSANSKDKITLIGREILVIEDVKDICAFDSFGISKTNVPPYLPLEKAIYPSSFKLSNAFFIVFSLV